LARLLPPEAYGTIAIVTLLVNFLNIFVNSGLSAALMRNRNADALDFSTVMIFSFVAANLLALALFAAAPFAAKYYQMPELTGAARALAPIIIFGSMSGVMTTYAMFSMRFKILFIVRLVTGVIGGIAGIIFAFSFRNVWALVYQSLIASFLQLIVLALALRWKFSLKFSFSRFKTMFSFSVFLLSGSIIAFISDNIYTQIVASNYSAADVGFNAKGLSIPSLLLEQVCGALIVTLLPTLTSYSDNMLEAKAACQRILRSTVCVIYPMAFGLIAVAKTAIVVLYTEKWLPSASIMQTVSLIYLIYPLLIVSANVLNLLGAGKTRFLLEALKALLSVLVLTLAMSFFTLKVHELYYFRALIYIAVYLMVSGVISKNFKYAVMEQIKDVGLPLIISTIMAVCVVLVSRLWVLPSALSLALQSLIGFCVYVLLSYITKSKGFMDILDVSKTSLRAVYSKFFLRG
jgi:O-antigen/teichoic acid export membrane protein